MRYIHNPRGKGGLWVQVKAKRTSEDTTMTRAWYSVRTTLVTVTVVEVGAGRFSKTARGRTIMFIQTGPSGRLHY